MEIGTTVAQALSALFISRAVNLNIASNFHQGRGKVNKTLQPHSSAEIMEQIQSSANTPVWDSPSILLVNHKTRVSVKDLKIESLMIMSISFQSLHKDKQCLSINIQLV